MADPKKPSRRSKAIAGAGDGAGHGASRKCGAKTRAGHPCEQPAGYGTPHLGRGRCMHHGGATKNHIIKAEREAAAEAVEETVDRLGLRDAARGTNGIDALQESLDLARADMLAASLRMSVLDPSGWKQRSDSDVERPSALFEVYDRCRRHYFTVARECIALGIAAQAASAITRDIDQVETLLQTVVQRLGHNWDDTEVREAMVYAIDRLTETES